MDSMMQYNTIFLSVQTFHKKIKKKERERIKDCSLVLSITPL